MTANISFHIPDIIPKTNGAYIVGGCIRDILMGRQPADYDIAVAGSPLVFAEKFARQKKFAQQNRCKIIKIGKPGKEILRIIKNGLIFDITSLNLDSIESDLMQRDFSINAIAFDLYSEKLLDPARGIEDIKTATLKMVSDQIFKKDPIRLLRAFRIGAELNFSISDKTLNSIEKDSYLIQNCAAERISSELLKLFNTNSAYFYLKKAVETKLIFYIFPELKPLKDCHANNYHDFDVFRHSLKTFYHVESIINNRYFPGSMVFEELQKYFYKERESILKFAALLHDTGKAYTKKNSSFWGHDSKGADINQKICIRLRLSSSNTNFIENITRTHLIPMRLFFSNNNKPTAKAIRRFFIKHSEIVPDLIIHSIADNLAKKEHPLNTGEFTNFALKMLESFFLDFIPKKSAPKLITGDDLIKYFKIKPSPLFKKILDYVEENRLASNISNKKEALKAAEAFIKDKYNKNFDT